VQGAAVVTAVAAVTFPNSSVLEVVVSSKPNGTLVIPLFNFSFYVGGFASARSVNMFDSCSTLGSPVISYSSSSASALISVDSSACSPQTNQLSTGAIVGIAIGAAVGGIAVAVAIVLITKAVLSRHDSSVNAALKMDDMSQLKAAQTRF
jgi:hypothetical protein